MDAELDEGRRTMKSVVRVVTLAVAAFILAGYLPTTTHAATLHHQKRVASIRTAHDTEQRVVHSDPVSTAVDPSSLAPANAEDHLTDVPRASTVEAGLEPRQSRAPPGGMPRA